MSFMSTDSNDRKKRDYGKRNKRQGKSRKKVKSRG